MAGIEVRATIRQIMDAGLWDEYCELTGCNPWVVNEGLADSSETVKVPLGRAGKLIESLQE